MVVTAIVITTIIVFIVVDLLLRIGLSRVRAERLRKDREAALEAAVRLDVSEEAPSLKRVAIEEPEARILAVDDEAAILDSFRKMLVLGGYSVDTVESGAEALGLIRRNDYDFVFTDLKMPGMDGVEVTKAVKHLRPDIDVIVITGFATIDTAVETVRAGAMDYVEKPFTEDELLAFVRKAVIQRRDRLERQAPRKIRLVRPGTPASESPFELNVPAGAFVSPQHAWVQIALNGRVRIGLDDLVRKIFGPVDRVALPEGGASFKRGQPLFSVYYGDHEMAVPAPLSGKVLNVNTEHAEHPEWLAVKPFELSWVCEFEPSDLAGELPALKIGQAAVDWYESELDRYARLAEGAVKTPPQEVSADSGQTRDVSLLARFSEPFLHG
jgi:CheY-like chemotaxis protein/glycine cleavage system H lipoate-binding protein